MARLPKISRLPANPARVARPARFQRERLLIVGCGDIGLRVVRLLGGRLTVLALTSSPQRCAVLRAAGVRPLSADLDQPHSLRRFAGLASRVLHLAPPPADGDGDRRTQALLHALRRARAPASLVYASTSGVYGDCQGQLVIETRAPQADTARARRRLDAENAVRRFAIKNRANHAGTASASGRFDAKNAVPRPNRPAGRPRCSILRIPGIYAPDRVGGTPRQRLQHGIPALLAADDVYTNHIHADDLARACLLALWRGRAQRIVNISDDTQLKMGDYFDLAADLYGLARPPRLSRAELARQVSPLLLSFMSESRRLDNTRMKRELGLRLRHASVAQGLR